MMKYLAQNYLMVFFIGIFSLQNSLNAVVRGGGFRGGARTFAGRSSMANRSFARTSRPMARPISTQTRFTGRSFSRPTIKQVVNRTRSFSNRPTGNKTMRPAARFNQKPVQRSMQSKKKPVQRNVSAVKKYYNANKS